MARFHYNTLSAISAQISGVDFGSLITGTLPSSQPAVPGLWQNGSTLQFYDGTSNNVVDFNEGQLLDAFGVSQTADV